MSHFVCTTLVHLYPVFEARRPNISFKMSTK